MDSIIRSALRGFVVSLILILVVGADNAFSQSETTPTRLQIRAVAHDAKIIGSGVGGARIVVQDAATGAILAEGVQEGGTGNTESIVVNPIERGGRVFDTEGAAAFTATLDLARPTMVDITAYGPLGTPHAMVRSSKRMLVVPGHDVLGEGVILELNGFTVELTAPGTDIVPRAGAALPIRARVTMLCGCPIEPGGLWDADRIEVVARIVQGDAVLAETPLSYAGQTSMFSGSVRWPDAGGYTLEVLAMEPERANFGRAALRLVGVD